MLGDRPWRPVAAGRSSNEELKENTSDGKDGAFDQEARDALRRGVSKLSQAVRVTLGPRGRNVILQKSFGSPTVTKDGVTVAKEIDLEDVYENMGARMVREVASKTSDVAGDGTTTATIMAEAIFNEGLRAVVAGVNPVHLKRDVDRAVATSSPSSEDVDYNQDEGEIAVGSIAASNATGKSATSWRSNGEVGKDGVITVERQEPDHGSRSGSRACNRPRLPVAVFRHRRRWSASRIAYVLIRTKKISSVRTSCRSSGRGQRKPLLIVAEHRRREARRRWSSTTPRVAEGGAVKAPAGDRRKACSETSAF